jgi:hypothetical protein
MTYSRAIAARSRSSTGWSRQPDRGSALLAEHLTALANAVPSEVF